MSKQDKPPSAFRALNWMIGGVFIGIVIVCSGVLWWFEHYAFNF